MKKKRKKERQQKKKKLSEKYTESGSHRMKKKSYKTDSGMEKNNERKK